MSPDDFTKIMAMIQDSIQKTVPEAIEKHVNGKIKNLDTKIDKYIENDMAWKKEDEKWKANAQPTITLGSSAINWWSFTKWILVTTGVVSGFFIALQAIKESIRL